MIWQDILKFTYNKSLYHVHVSGAVAVVSSVEENK